MQVAVLLPSTVVIVISVVPALIPITLPLESTIATAMLLEFHITSLLVALVGEIVSIKVFLAPAFTVKLLLFRLTPVTGAIISMLKSTVVTFST